MNDTKKRMSFLLDDPFRKKLIKLGYIISAAIFLVWTGYGIVAYVVFGNWNNGGTFGDTFGSINALFSGLALAGVILAILLQSKELEYQRKELRLTRDEIRGQKEQLQAQNETLRVQNFESTFFQMLRLHHEIVNAIDIQYTRISKNLKLVEVGAKGRDGFVYLYDELKSHHSQSQVKDEPEKVNAAFKELFARHQSNIGHYFRNLYNVIKFIDRKGPEQFEEKYVYTNLVRAQLSSHELLLLFYNALSEFGRDKFKPLIEKYHLLKNMPLGHIIQRGHESYYNPSAFKKASES